MKKYHKWGMIMFSEFGDEGGGGGEETQTAASEAPVESKSAAPVVDADALAEKFGGVIAKQFQEQEARQTERNAPAMTPEEARKLLKHFDITPEFITKFGNLETQKSALEEFRDGIATHAITVAQALLQKQQQSWEEKFQPVQQILTERQEIERVGRFHKAYPTLANPDLQDLITATGQKMATSGAFKNLSEAESFTKLANGVESVIKKINPNFKLSASDNNERNSNEIPSQSHGSGGGGSNGTPRGSKVSAVSILGDVPGKSARK